MPLELCLHSKCQRYALKCEAEMPKEAEQPMNSVITLLISLSENGGSGQVSCHSGFNFSNVLLYFDKCVKEYPK